MKQTSIVSNEREEPQLVLLTGVDQRKFASFWGAQILLKLMGNQIRCFFAPRNSRFLLRENDDKDAGRRQLRWERASEQEIERETHAGPQRRPELQGCNTSAVPTTCDFATYGKSLDNRVTKWEDSDWWMPQNMAPLYPPPPPSNFKNWGNFVTRYLCEPFGTWGSNLVRTKNRSGFVRTGIGNFENRTRNQIPSSFFLKLNNLFFCWYRKFGDFFGGQFK